jgi:signal transduction histidine kinase/CheY-like chemotaxis protein
MKLYQKYFEENSVVTVFGQIFLYVFLVLLDDGVRYHPSISIQAIIMFSALSLSKIIFIFFSKGDESEKQISFALIWITALFWALCYLAELMVSSQLNQTTILLYLLLSGFAYGGSFVFYKNQVLNYGYITILLLFPAVSSLIYLEEMKIPFTVMLLVSLLINAFYSRFHYANWKEFLSAKEHIEETALKLEKTNLQLENALKDAEMAAKIKGDFIATVSHEIRTPMNGVMGMSALLLETKLTKEQKEYTQMITHSSDALLVIINDILDFSKLESGKLYLEHIPFELNRILKELSLIFGEKAAKQGIDFQLIMPENTVNNFIGDPVRLRQVLTNLIGNAIKFTSQGYVKLSLKTELINQDVSEIKFKIEDTGIGIEPEKLKTIFDRFTQADTSTTRKFGGTGLGLAITKELLTIMDGKIDVSSKPGIGTIFFVSVPFQMTNQQEYLDIGDGDELSLLIAQKTKDTQILLVEDNKINQKVVMKMLEKTSCNIDLAENGQEAVDQVHQKKYDLIFMDIQMPVMSGVDATLEIRSKNNIEHIPIIAMTANAMKGDREKYIEAGMDDYISKPLKQNDLFKLLLKWLHKN